MNSSNKILIKKKEESWKRTHNEIERKRIKDRMRLFSTHFHATLFDHINSDYCTQKKIQQLHRHLTV